MALGDLPQTLAMLAVSLDGGMVQVQWSTAYVLTFEAGTRHAGTDPLDDEASLEFGDRADDYNDGAPQRTARVDILPERDVLDVEPVQFVEHIQKVLHRPGDPV